MIIEYLNLNLSDAEKAEIGFRFDDNNNLYFNGIHFSRYIAGSCPLLYCIEEKEYYIYEDGYYKWVKSYGLKKELRKAFIKYSKDVWPKNHHENYLSNLKYEANSISDMNTKKQYINLSNCLYNVEKDKLSRHTKKVYGSIRIPIEYNKKAKCPKFEEFLLDISSNDRNMVSVIQEMMGYCLTTETKAQKAFLFHGSGANGKSVLLKVIEKLVGHENTSALTMNELNKNFSKACLINKMVNIASESEMTGKTFNTECFKAIITGDRIHADIKYKEPISYSPFCKLLIASNKLPIVKDSSDGYFRRLVILPFKKQYKGKNANKNLLEELLAELPGILNFALKGLRRLRMNNYEFTTSKVIKKELKKYKISICPMEVFYDDTLKADNTPTSRISTAELRKEYDDWCIRNGLERNKYSPHSFSAQLKEVMNQRNVNLKINKSDGTRYYYGIKLK